MEIARTIHRLPLWVCFITTVILSACKKEKTDPILTTDQMPSVGILETKPQNYPAGFAVDFESDSIVSLDQQPTFKYDLRMLAWRIKDTATGSYGGRPVVFLWGNTASQTKALALNVSTFASIPLGADGFTAFKHVTKEMKLALKPDTVFPINPDDTTLYKWQDGFIIMKEDLLLNSYKVLVIGDKVVRLEQNVSPVWLIKTAEGNYFKWQHIERQGGGHVPIRWYRFKSNEID